MKKFDIESAKVTKKLFFLSSDIFLVHFVIEKHDYHSPNLVSFLYSQTSTNGYLSTIATSL